MEQKTIPFECKDVDEETGVFEGYAATFSNVPDSYGDIIDKGAFKKTIKENGRRVKILWNHDPKEPIGIPTEITEDAYGLKIKGKLSLGVQRAREVLSLMKDGVVNEMSIGYDTVTESFDKNIRHLKEIRLWDTSPVTFAANPEAMITAVKSELDSGAVDKIQAAIESLNALLIPAGQEPEKSTSPTETEAVIETTPELDALFSQLDSYKSIRDESRLDAALLSIGGKNGN